MAARETLLVELDDLMWAARRRVLHLIGVVGAAILVVSAEIVWHASLRNLPEVVVWFVGCVLIAVLARWWYNARNRAIARLREVVTSGKPTFRVVEVTRISLEHIIPFGWELDVELDDGERLAVGFWSRETCERVQRLLTLAGS